MPSWVTLILTTLGAGAIGSIITTYGSQARERRDARKEVLARMADAGRIAGDPSSDRPARLHAGQAVSIAAILAGVPVHVIDTYLLSYDAVRDPQMAWGPERHSPQDPVSVGAHVYREATELLTGALWHPWLSLPLRRYHTWRIRRFLVAILPPGAVIFLGRPRGARKWEREAIQMAKARRTGNGGA